MKRLAVLGSTGSIGRTTLEVVSAFPDRFRVVALTANRRTDVLAEQIARHRPEMAALADGDAPFCEGLRGTRLVRGWDGVMEAASRPDVDIVVNALVGAAGLEPTLAALEAGKRVALANKESLVVGGSLVIQALERGGGELIPVDSEHSAVFQCLDGADRGCVQQIVLTASGGPFRGREPEELVDVTPAEALQHPTWNMGSKITIDSATLVNKALEVVEAHFLFGMPYDRVSVVIHPQSIVHSLVEFQDGSILAQLGYPTMAVPVLYALTYPERLRYAAPTLDLAAVGSLTFEPVPPGRFAAFELGRRTAELGGTAPAVFNAASEEAVAAFLGERIRFTQIPIVIGSVTDRHAVEEVTGLADVWRADAWAREAARGRIEELTTTTKRRSG